LVKDPSRKLIEETDQGEGFAKLRKPNKICRYAMQVFLLDLIRESAHTYMLEIDTVTISKICCA